MLDRRATALPKNVSIDQLCDMVAAKLEKRLEEQMPSKPPQHPD